ncbi:MAG: sugar ABC transporter permease [Pseudomonadota bacterium]|uniref:carbohydrate ABC transporter permease n=1 Tax=Roseibium sp. TaxID=1936156 RepID=UPI003155499D
MTGASLEGVARQELTQARYGYAFALPAMLLIFGIILGPSLVVIGISLTDYELGALDWRWVGLGNYQEMLGDRTFWRSISNTFTYVAILVPSAVLLGLAVAIMVHARTRTKRIYEVIYFLPVTTTLVAMAIVWNFVLHSKIGPVNAVIVALGFEPIGFFSDRDVVLFSLALIALWQLIGFNMILFIAGLSAIPQDLYDAAAVDGADGWVDRFLRVTWPMLGPTTMFVVVTTTITAFKVFDTVAVLTNGGPRGASEVLLFSIYLEGFEYFRIGYASALTVAFLTFILLFSVVQAWVIDRNVHYR